MNLLLKKYFSIIVIVAALVIMGVVIWLASGSLKASIRERMNDIQKFYTSRENREQQINKLPELRDQFEAIGKNESVLAILLTEDHIVSFIQKVESLAQETNTEIVITSEESGVVVDQKKNVLPVTKETVTSEGGLEDQKKDESILRNLPYNKYLDLNISLTGKYADIVTFLYKLETLPVALDVISLDVRWKEDGLSRPLASGSGVNPFMLTPGGISTNSRLTNNRSAGEAIKKSQLEASFNTLVYIAQ